MDRRLAANFDWMLLVIILLICILDIIILYSATYNLEAVGGRPIYVKQIYWMALGLVVMLACVVVDYHFFERYAFLIYAAAVVSLILVLLIGPRISGAQRWLRLGFISFQPSEVLKLALLITIARYVHRKKIPLTRGYGFKDMVVPLLFLGLPFALILLEPDLGTAILVCAIFMSVMLFVKIQPQVLIMLAVAGVLSLPAGWMMLKGYQRERVMVFLNPERDPLGSGYHIIQSKIAVGSGMLFGKGFLDGTQNQLHFLPEQHTDFIFSVLAEEWGFVGSFVLLLLYLLLILRGLWIVGQARETFGAVLGFGVLMILFWQVLVNIGMVSGMLPVVGVPLPLMSYGGTSMLVTMAALGLLFNVNMRRFLFKGSGD